MADSVALSHCREELYKKRNYLAINKIAAQRYKEH